MYATGPIAIASIQAASTLIQFTEASQAGFPNPQRALIGSNQLWRVNDSSYYREYPVYTVRTPIQTLNTNWSYPLFSHSELKCARAHDGHVYFRHNFWLGPRSHLNELSKLPSQQLGSPGYYDRCHFERNDLICYSQYYQTSCHVKQTSHLITFSKSGRLFYWAIIEVCTKSWQWKYILACCHCYWCRFFVIRVPNRYNIVDKCCYIYIFMLPTVDGLQTPTEIHDSY